MSDAKNYVVISQARPMNYRRDYVSLPANYGTDQYYRREDVRSIIELVEQNLSLLDEKTGFTEKLKNKKVVIKPNLVMVVHDAGFKDREYPESTDPRVMDAIIIFLKKYTSDIVIVESSGRGMPTRASFRISGLDRVARHHGLGILALEEQPVDRYILPKAKVMKEIIVPRIFSEVAAGRAFYISVPKMKTNLYTGVTLGFKNAMGTITYNLRQRNHNYCIDQKLVDMLYLFRPHLTIIDGIVGGEGNCPAPVEPVDSQVIISGTNSVETDRVATRMMGFDPREIDLMRIADEMGFGDPQVEIIGTEKVTPFRPADPSLVGEWMAEKFPNVKVLVGFTINNAPRVEGLKADNQLMRKMELACRGGCLATTRFAFDMVYYEDRRRDFHLNLILGDGVKEGGKTYYFDRHGKAYSTEEIARLPGKKLAVGSCTKPLAGMVDRHVDGCMTLPNSPHMALHWLSGTFCTVMSPKNKQLMSLLVGTLQTMMARIKLIRQGQRLDCPMHFDDSIVEPRPLSEEEKEKDYIPWPLPPLTGQEKRQLIKNEIRSVLATFKG
ncbi:MAG: DUF362 domain-containing protein [Dethiobacteria bacterium]